MTDEAGEARSMAIVLNRDLMFGSRIRAALKMLGLEARFVATTEQLIEALTAYGDTAAIAIVDMNSAVRWDVLGEALSTSQDGPPILGFGPHTDVENRRAAKAARVSRILSNGQFQSDMVGLIDRYRRR